MNHFVSFFINEGIDFLLYFILLIFVYQLIVAINEKSIEVRKVRRKFKSRLHKQFIEKKVEGLKSEKHFFGQLNLLLKATSKSNKTAPSVFVFLLFSGSLGLLTFMLLIFKINDLYISGAIAIFSSTLPYLYLKVKFRKRKSSVSNHITTIIEELIHHYSASGHDMYRAVKNVAKDTNNPHYRRLFLQITSAMHSRHEASIKEAVDLLAYSVGGTWAKRLGNIILTGYIRSYSVMKALVHLSNDAQNTEGMLKEEKAASFGKVIAAWATIPFFLGALFINSYVTRAFDYWKIQFGNPVMVFLLVSTCVMIFVSILCALYLRHPKNDL